MKNKVFRNVVFISTGIICLGFLVYLLIPYLNIIFRFEQKTVSEYQTISLKSSNSLYEIDFELKKGKSFQYPLFAAWIEDSVGNYVETLYISKTISTSIFNHKVLRRPESLPCWSHSRNIKAEDGLYIPLHSASDLDAVTGATPRTNFMIKTGSMLDGIGHFRILFELNQSFDWNDSYTKNSYPNDSIYSGSGGVGQPSLIYEVDVDKNNLKERRNFNMKIIGHGHHSGKTGIIYNDLTGVTTALSIADSIKVSIQIVDKL